MSEEVEPEIVTKTRQTFIRMNASHEWPDPEEQSRVTEELLRRLKAVPYEGDDDAYMRAAFDVAAEFMNPIVVENRKLAAIWREFDMQKPHTKH